MGERNIPGGKTEKGKKERRERGIKEERREGGFVLFLTTEMRGSTTRGLNSLR